jgi:hypothetical protein
MVRVYEHTSIKLHDGRMRAPSSQNRIERNSNLVLILFRAPLSLSLSRLSDLNRINEQWNGSNEANSIYIQHSFSAGQCA